MAGNTPRCFSLAGVAVLSACASAPPATIRHAMGEARIAGSPARVVVLTNEGTEALLALGIRPAGAVRSWSPGSTWYPHLRDRLEGVAVVGDEDHVDVAAVARLRPELILGNKLRQASRYSDLAAIAPTVFSETLRGEWKRNLVLYAGALRRDGRARGLMADWNRLVDAARTQLGDPTRTRVAVVRFMPDRARIYHQETFSGVVLGDLGFSSAEYRRANDFFEDLPLERVDEIGADVIFHFTYEDGSGSATEWERSWTDAAGWRALPAVQAGRAFRVDDGVWNTAGGILAARLLVQDIVRCLRPPGMGGAAGSGGNR